MKAVILAAGLGTRLSSINNNIPKCLIKINRKTILENQIMLLDLYGIKERYIVIGTKGLCWSQMNYGKILSITNNIILNFANDITHNTYSIYLALKRTNPDDVLLIDGDLFLTSIFFKKALDTKFENYMITKIADNRAEPGTKVITNKDGHVKKLGKTLIVDTFPWDIHSGFFKISKRDYDFFLSLVSKTSNHNKEIEGPLRVFCKKRDLYANRISSNYWVNINTAADLERARRL